MNDIMQFFHTYGYDLSNRYWSLYCAVKGHTENREREGERVGAGEN